MPSHIAEVVLMSLGGGGMAGGVGRGEGDGGRTTDAGTVVAGGGGGWGRPLQRAVGRWNALAGLARRPRLRPGSGGWVRGGGGRGVTHREWGGGDRPPPPGRPAGRAAAPAAGGDGWPPPPATCVAPALAGGGWVREWVGHAAATAATAAVAVGPWSVWGGVGRPADTPGRRGACDAVWTAADSVDARRHLPRQGAKWRAPTRGAGLWPTTPGGPSPRGAVPDARWRVGPRQRASVRGRGVPWGMTLHAQPTVYCVSIQCASPAMRWCIVEYRTPPPLPLPSPSKRPTRKEARRVPCMHRPTTATRSWAPACPHRGAPTRQSRGSHCPVAG